MIYGSLQLGKLNLRILVNLQGDGGVARLWDKSDDKQSQNKHRQNCDHDYTQAPKAWPGARWDRYQMVPRGGRVAAFHAMSPILIGRR